LGPTRNRRHKQTSPLGQSSKFLDRIDNALREVWRASDNHDCVARDGASNIAWVDSKGLGIDLKSTLRSTAMHMHIAILAVIVGVDIAKTGSSHSLSCARTGM
jgi:hypothetical protein